LCVTNDSNESKPFVLSKGNISNKKINKNKKKM